MKPATEGDGTRHGKRAPGKTKIGISISEDVVTACRLLADSQDRSLSNWIERALKEKLAEYERSREEGSAEAPAPPARAAEHKGNYGAGEKDSKEGD